MKRIIPPLCFVMIGGLLLSGCFSNKILKLSDKELFTLGSKQYEKKKFIKSRETLTLLIDHYPDSQYCGDAQLMKADAFFKERNYIEAGVEYNLFLEFHPAHPRADYALYQEAECSYKHISTIDRDSTNVIETIQKLEKLIRLYKDSDYLPRARERLLECQQHQNSHDLYVARFYDRWEIYSSSIHRYQVLLNSQSPLDEELKAAAEAELALVKQKYYSRLMELSQKNIEKGRWYGVIDNFERLLTTFPEEKANEAVLFQLANAYMNTKKKDKAIEYFQTLVRDFPQGQYTEKARENLRQLEQETG